MQHILKELRETSGVITSKIIKDLITDHAPVARKMRTAYERYKGSPAGVPIFSRRFEDSTKINNKLNNDFYSEIIDTKVGYFAGKPITYQLDKNEYMIGDNIDEAHYKLDFAQIDEFNRRNSIESLDSETAKMAAICGYGARLLYIDKEGLEMVMNIDPWEVIFVADRSIDEPQYALRYYTIKDNNEDKLRVEWYDDKYITYYIQTDSGYMLDPTEPINPQPHLFEGVPLIGFLNNEEMQGDVEKVETLIDAYDRTLSDVNSEIEQFRLAYMKFTGVEIDREELEKAKRTGAFELPEGADMGFVTKMLDDTIIEHHLDRIEQNILRFAKSVNFGDEAFAGNMSGVAMKFKLFNLESKCITCERKFAAGLRQQFKLLTSVWAKKGFGIDYLNIWFDFKRNLPLNLLDEAQTSATLKGLVSEETRLGLLSFVDDVNFELTRMEYDDTLDLDAIGGDDNAGEI